MMWDSEQPVDTVEDDGDDSMQDVGAAKHMPVSGSLRETRWTSPLSLGV